MKSWNFRNPSHFFKAVLLLFLLGFLVYGRALSFDFVHDDNLTIKSSPIVKPDLRPGHIFQVFQSNGMVPYYRPLLEALYQVTISSFGNKNPVPYHLLNIVMHIINGILLYVLVEKFFRKRDIALYAAVLFTVHPAQTETVAAIAGIPNILSTFFCLSGFLLYVHATSQSKYQNLARYVGCLFLFVVALLFKEPAIMFPVLLLLYEIFVASKSGMSNRLRIIRLSGVFLVALWYLLFRKAMVGFVTTTFIDNTGELWLRLLAIPRSLLGYVQVIIYPVNLHYLRSVDILKPYFAPMVSWIALILGVTVLLASFSKKDRDVALFGLAWFAVALLPTLNFLPLIIEYSYIYNSEHFLYLPLVGFVIFLLKSVEYLCGRFFPKNPGKIFAVTCIVMAGVFIAAAVKQTGYWRNDIVLFQRTLAFEPQLGRAHIILARSHYFKGEISLAIDHYGQGLAIMHEYAEKAGNAVAEKFYRGFIKEIHFDLAHCYEAQNDFNSAVLEYKKALLVDNTDAVIYNNMGVAYLRLAKAEEAKKCFEAALARDSRDVLAMTNLAVFLIQEGKRDEAQDLLREAVALNPDFAPARSSLDRLRLEMQGQ